MTDKSRNVSTQWSNPQRVARNQRRIADHLLYSHQLSLEGATLVILQRDRRQDAA